MATWWSSLQRNKWRKTLTFSTKQTRRSRKMRIPLQTQSMPLIVISSKPNTTMQSFLKNWESSKSRKWKKKRRKIGRWTQRKKRSNRSIRSSSIFYKNKLSESKDSLRKGMKKTKFSKERKSTSPMCSLPREKGVRVKIWTKERNSRHLPNFEKRSELFGWRWRITGQQPNLLFYFCFLTLIYLFSSVQLL